MEQLPKMESKNEKELSFVLENEKEFGSWEEKTEFIKLYFIKNRHPEELVEYKEKLKGKDFIEKGFELEKSYEQEDIVDFIKILNEAYHSAGQENNNLNSGILSFDGRYIHINKDENVETENYSIEQSLSLLAEHLSNQDLVPDYIGASSWLMGNEVIRKKMGFEKKKEIEFDPNRGSDVWGQFVDDKGNIKKKELQYLFENNEPRYKLTKAEISFKDFMQKYGNQFLDRDFTVEYDFREEQEGKLEQNQRIIDNYFKNFDKANWFQGFYEIACDLPLWRSLLETEKGKIFFDRIAKLEKESIDLDQLKPRVDQIKNDLDFDDFQQEQREKFLVSRNKREKIYLEKKIKS